jgi:2-polyprenyl-6-methoxyphenol hydroxylase-like FAD-dependent oxidoreductase
VIDARRLGLDIGDDTVLQGYQRRRRFDALALAAVADGTEGSNPSSSSSESVSAVNPEAVGEKSRTLAAVCVSLGT